MNFKLIRIENEILHLDNSLKDLEEMISRGTITSTDATDEWQEIMDRKFKLKEKYVQTKHVNKDGSPKKISYHEPTSDYPQGYYYTKISNNYKPKRATMPELICVLYDHYHINDDEEIADNSLGAVWKLAFDEFKATKTSTEKTFKLIQGYYKRYINDSLAKKDITKITLVDLQKYTKDLVSGKDKLSINNYNEYKQVLNIIYRYARIHDLVKEELPELLDNKEYKKLCKPKKSSSQQKILSVDEIDSLKGLALSKCQDKNYNVYGFMILLSIETGMRAAELCSIKWSDISDDSIHIHTQQLETEERPIRYYEVDWTKNEKGISRDGRNFPLTNNIKTLLKLLKDAQTKAGISSDYIFVRSDSEWVPKRQYEKALYDACKKLKLPKTNNHALRMSLNSNVLIPKGMPVTMRAKILGHSVETNLNYYSFETKDYINESLMLLEA